jgi:flagellar motor switch/type III secretory pathway protein FliN
LAADLRKVSAYPWAALERLNRQGVVQANLARRRIAAAVDLQRLAASAREVLNAPVALSVRGAGPSSPAWHGPRLRFEDGSGSCAFLLEPSPALVNDVLARVLRQRASLWSGDGPLEPVLAGAFSAVVIEVARNTRSELPLHAFRDEASPNPALALECTVCIEDRPYAARLWVRADAQPTLGGTGIRLRGLGELPIALPLVAALSAGSRAQLAELEPGDAWLPGGGWFLEAAGHGRAVLAPSGSEQGISVDVQESGQIVVGGEVVPLSTDGGNLMTQADDAGSQSISQTVLDAPLAIRVELGTVSMRAREWAEIRPGDVIETGRRIADFVSLRVAGVEVARGELVNVEGELGVRVLELCMDAPLRA